MITYEPFWDTLNWRDISTYTLIKEHHISSSTINRLRHNKAISTATVDKLCGILGCYVDDIIKFLPDKKN